MKTVSAAMLTLLATRQFYLVDLFTFRTVGGNIYYYCSGDKDVIVSGNTYSCGGATGPYFKRNSNITWETGLQVSTLEFTVDPGPSGSIFTSVGSVAFSTACTQGYFDYADVLVERAIMPTYGDVSSRPIPIFNGIMGPIEGGRGPGERFVVNSYTDLLNIDMPRNLIQPNCVNTLYDSACSLIKASFGVNGTVLSGSTVSSINATLSQETGYFDLGSITFLTGANASQVGVRSVQTYTLGVPCTIALIPPLLTTPTAGDTFTIYPGCDKAQSTCRAKFANLDNFRGAPGVPTPETAV